MRRLADDTLIAETVATGDAFVRKVRVGPDGPCWSQRAVGLSAASVFSARASGERWVPETPVE